MPYVNIKVTREGVTRVLVAGLTEVRVQVHEPGQDQGPAGAHAVRVRAVEPGQALQHPVADGKLGRTLAARRGIHRPAAHDPVGSEVAHAFPPWCWAPASR